MLGEIMTLHAYTEYKCKNCGFRYVPIPSAPQCPYCGSPSEVVFDEFVDKFLSSVSHNIIMYRSIVPPAWATITIGDYYFLIGFFALEYMVKKLGLRNNKALLMEGVDLDKCLDIVEQFIREKMNRVVIEWDRLFLKHVEAFLKEVCHKLQSPETISDQ